MSSKTKKKKKTIVFAIPSYNEADSIGQLTKIIDRGLIKYFSSYETIIVNIDNDSPDGTKQAFLDTPTKSKKIYLTSRGKPRHLRGKGYHMKMAFVYAKKVNAHALGFIDGDVVSAKPEWVRDLIQPILKGYDHVLPIYLRNEYDGSITNHFAYPILYGLLHADIRQPLGGEIGLSQKAITQFLSRSWYSAANHYGVDIFLVTESIFHTHKIAQTFLGIKSHKPSAPKLDNMFLEVSDSLLRQLRAYRSQWQRPYISDHPVRLIKDRVRRYHTPELAFDYKRIKEGVLQEYRRSRGTIYKAAMPYAGVIDDMFRGNGSFYLTAELWAHVVYHFILRNKQFSILELKALRVLFYVRFLSYYKNVIEKTHLESEKAVVRQAHLFRAFRSLALK